MSLSKNEEWLITAAKRAQQYLNELATGNRPFGSLYQDISVGRDLAAAIEAVEHEQDTSKMLAESRY